MSTSATRLNGMLVRESAYAEGMASAMHSDVEIVEVTTLMRNENSTSSDEIASPKWATPPATMAKMALPMNNSTTVATATATFGKMSRFLPRCLRPAARSALPIRRRPP